MHYQMFETEEDRGRGHGRRPDRDRRGCFARAQYAGPQEWFEGGFGGGRGFEGRGGEFSGHGHFGFGRRGRRWERGFGGGRLFDAGDLKLVILKLLSEEPSYGYQLMKKMEERLAGGYTPSAGVIYPTLTMLEEEGLATAATSADNKKVYTVTPAGLGFLEENKERVAELFARLEEARGGFERGNRPEIMKAFMNLRGAVMARVFRGNVTAEQIKKITEAINAAARAIDEL
jgi:DNA-binding PadR family transcriptional regulator